MDESARKVLKACKGDILKNLILNEDILDTLEENEILTEDMVETVKVEKTQPKKIAKLLYTLKRRGPNAFPVFVDAIRPDFSFLADKLENKYEAEVKKSDSKSTSERSSSGENTDVKTSSTDSASSPISCLMDFNCNLIQGNHFPTLHHGKKPAKTAIHHPLELGDTITSSKSDKSSNNLNQSWDITQEKLNCLYTKLKTHMTSTNMRELSFKSPEPVTFEMVEELLDDLLKTVDKCYSALGAKDRSSLLTHIIDLKESKRKMKTELKDKEEQRNKYADNIMKLENTCRNSGKQVEDLTKQNKKLHIQTKQIMEVNTSLKEENAKMKEMLDRKSENVDLSKENLKKAEKKIENLVNKFEIEREHMDKELKSLDNELKNYKKENEKLKRKLDQKPKFAFQNHGVANRNRTYTVRNHNSQNENISSLKLESHQTFKDNVVSNTHKGESKARKTLAPSSPQEDSQELNARIENNKHEAKKLEARTSTFTTGKAKLRRGSNFKTGSLDAPTITTSITTSDRNVLAKPESEVKSDFSQRAIVQNQGRMPVNLSLTSMKSKILK